MDIRQNSFRETKTLFIMNYSFRNAEQTVYLLLNKTLRLFADIVNKFSGFYAV